MSARSFFDTNVLVYLDDRSSPSKQGRALELYAEHRRAGTGVVSIQVLQEYFVTATAKYAVDAASARRKVELFAEFDVVVPSVADVLGAIDLHRLRGLSFWDAMVVSAAKQAGCAVLLTEDLQDGQELDGVRVVNPFRGDAPVAHERAASHARTAARGRSGAGGGPAGRRGARGKHR